MLGISTLGNRDAAFVGIRDNLELLVGDDILVARFGVARVRHHGNIVKAAHQRRRRLDQAIFENAKALLGQVVLGHAVVMVQRSLRAPTHMEHAVNIGKAPVHDFNELGPVVNALEVEGLNGGSCNDHAVVAKVAHLVKRAIKRLEMIG